MWGKDLTEELNASAMATSDKVPDELGAKPVDTALPKSKQPLSRVKRELTDDELLSPGVPKLLLGDIERLTEENLELRQYRDRFHEVDRELAVVREELSKSRTGEILLTGCFTLGGIALGALPAIFSISTLFGFVLLAIGGGLLVLGAVARHTLR